MIARIEFSYEGRGRLVEVAKDPISLAHLQEIFGGATPAGEHLGMDYMWPAEILIDMDSDAPRLLQMGITYTVKAFKGTIPLKTILPDGATYNVHVQIPHVGLLAVDEVEVVEDYCTDQLQRKLNEGWRILCVCPPNAARRPDYILGRTKERT